MKAALQTIWRIKHAGQFLAVGKLFMLLIWESTEFQQELLLGVGRAGCNSNAEVGFCCNAKMGMMCRFVCFDFVGFVQFFLRCPIAS